MTFTMPYVEMGQGTYTADPDAGRGGARRSRSTAFAWSMRRLTRRPTATRCWPACRRPAGRPPSWRRGSHFARPAPWRARCWSRRRRSDGRSRRTRVAPRRAKSSTPGAAAAHPMARWRLPLRGCRCPKDVPLKDPKTFKLIGTPAKRLDAGAKVNGTAVFGIDARPPGVKVATLAQSPVFGGRLKRVDDRAAKAVKGVRQIVQPRRCRGRRRRSHGRRAQGAGRAGHRVG